jgi:hypothetical protein
MALPFFQTSTISQPAQALGIEQLKISYEKNVFSTIDALEILHNSFETFINTSNHKIDRRPVTNEYKIAFNACLIKINVFINECRNIDPKENGSRQKLAQLANKTLNDDRNIINGGEAYYSDRTTSNYHATAQAQINKIENCFRVVALTIANKGYISAEKMEDIAKYTIGSLYSHYSSTANDFEHPLKEIAFDKTAVTQVVDNIRTTCAGKGTPLQNIQNALLKSNVLGQPSHLVTFEAKFRVFEQYYKPLDAINILSNAFEQLSKDKYSQFSNTEKKAMLKASENLEAIKSEFEKFSKSNDLDTVKNFKDATKNILESKENDTRKLYNINKTILKIVNSIADNGLISESKLRRLNENLLEEFSEKKHSIIQDKIYDLSPGKFQKYTDLGWGK